MKSAFFLAWRYILYNRVKTGILVICIAITLFLPLSVNLLVRAYDQQLLARARATPLILGSRGNRYDLILQSLYFRTGRLDPVPAAIVDEVNDTDLARAIPLHTRFTAASFPIIGTSLEYFDFRDLRYQTGRLPAILGEAIIGSHVAEELGLGTDDSLISDQQNIYDLSRTVPVKLRIVGVLEATHSPDDYGVFVDVKTGWVIEGLGHGHMNLTETEPTDTQTSGYVLERGDGHVKANAALETHVEITRENLDDFHFHGDTGTFPLSAIVIVPDDSKGATILKTRYNAAKEYRVLSPEEVVEELMGIVFRVKAFFDANFAMVGISTVLFLVLVIILSQRIRRDEYTILQRMGGGPGLVFWLQAAELAIIGAISATLAAALALVLLWLSPNLFQLL